MQGHAALLAVSSFVYGSGNTFGELYHHTDRAISINSKIIIAIVFGLGFLCINVAGHRLAMADSAGEKSIEVATVATIIGLVVIAWTFIRPELGSENGAALIGPVFVFLFGYFFGRHERRSMK